MYISGSVGFTLLHGYNKYVLLFADIHDGVKYCMQDSIMIDKWLNANDNNDVLLEEVIREQFNLKELWPNSPHTQGLKNLNINNHNIKPVDIRPLLVPFSWELADNEKPLYKMLLVDYESRLNDLFNLKKTKFFITYILPEVKKLKNNEKFRVSLITHFYYMKELFDELFIDKLKTDMSNNYMHQTIYYLSINNRDILEKINNLISMIMEWYILVLIHNSTKNSIIHVGLAHSNKLLNLLKDVYGFKVITQNGVNEMNEIEDEAKACVLVPNEINNIFDKKYTQKKSHL
jgi:hypothetical protein